MKPINIILTALLLSLLATVAPLATPHAADTSSLVAADYYVAADGNDSNPGTILQPFATIEKARIAVQSRIATGMTKDITVVLRGETKHGLSPSLAASVSNRPYDHADALKYATCQTKTPDTFVCSLCLF